MLAHMICLSLALRATEALPVPALPPRLCLVRAVVIDEQETRLEFLNTLRIEHVYVGAADIKGRKFSAYSGDKPFRQVSGYVIVPRLKLGETGIWLLKQASDEFYPEHIYNYMRWPARVEHQRVNWPSYDKIGEFSDAVESFSRVRERSEAIARLVRLTTDKNPYLSSWSVSRLATAAVKDEHVGSLLERLVAGGKVPLQGQVELDNALIVVRNDGWRKSKQRYDLFRGWLGGEMDSNDADLVANHLSLVSQQPATTGFPQEELLALTKLLIENDHFPLPDRRLGTIVLTAAARQYDDDSKVFKMATDLLGSDLQDELRARIAWGIVREFDLDSGRREVISKLRTGAKEKPLVDAFDAALARPDKVKKP